MTAPNPVITQAEYDNALMIASALRFTEVGVSPATLDGEHRVIVLTVDHPNEADKEIPVAIVFDQEGDLFHRLTPAAEPVTLEATEDEADDDAEESA